MKTLISLSVLILPITLWSQTLEGTAKNSNGEIVYFEKHKIEKDQNGLTRQIRVEYTKPNGIKFAEMISDFSKNRNIPETTFEDSRFRSKSSLRLIKDSVVFEELRNGKLHSTKSFPLNENMVASQGFDNFIQMNRWALEKNPVEFKFGVIDTQDFYSLTGYAVRSITDNEIRYKIRASNWFARLFAGELLIAYDIKKMRIKSFNGRSNIMDDSGSSQNVTIEYQWNDDV